MLAGVGDLLDDSPDKNVLEIGGKNNSNVLGAVESFWPWVDAEAPSCPSFWHAVRIYDSDVSFSDLPAIWRSSSCSALSSSLNIFPTLEHGVVLTRRLFENQGLEETKLQFQSLQVRLVAA